jgi:hypothetical protein
LNLTSPEKQAQRDPEGVAPTEKQQQCQRRQRQALPAIANQQLQAILHDRRGIMGNDQAFGIGQHAILTIDKSLKPVVNGEGAVTLVLAHLQQCGSAWRANTQKRCFHEHHMYREDVVERRQAINAANPLTP